MTDILVPISPGELIDKITVLQIKRERIVGPAKLKNILAELSALEQVRAARIGESEQIRTLSAELRAANARLFDTISAIYACERAGDFGPGFVSLARTVYVENDRRAIAKRRINELLSSKIFEEKAHL